MASKNLKGISTIAEMYKRCPPKQLEKFKKFKQMNAEYRKRVNKYPEKLPNIDWEYYRTNVRDESIKIVNEFEKKYKELQQLFDSRINLDLSKYYIEINKQRCEVECELQQFKSQSNKRIEDYKKEIKRIQDLMPYDQMTIEEFIELCPELADLIPHSKKPLFWPFLPEEQTPGPISDPKGITEGGDDDGQPPGKGEGDSNTKASPGPVFDRKHLEECRANCEQQLKKTPQSKKTENQKGDVIPYITKKKLKPRSIPKSKYLKDLPEIHEEDMEDIVHKAPPKTEKVQDKLQLMGSKIAEKADPAQKSGIKKPDIHKCDIVMDFFIHKPIAPSISISKYLKDLPEIHDEGMDDIVHGSPVKSFAEKSPEKTQVTSLKKTDPAQSSNPKKPDIHKCDVVMNFFF